MFPLGGGFARASIYLSGMDGWTVTYADYGNIDDILLRFQNFVPTFCKPLRVSYH